MGNNACIRILANVEQINNCKEKIDLTKQVITGLAETFALAGNDVRLKILYLLHEEKELCVCDLSDILGMKIPAVSQHLRKLKDGGLVTIRKDGPTYYYHLDKELPGILAHLLGYIKASQLRHDTKRFNQGY